MYWHSYTINVGAHWQDATYEESLALILIPANFSIYIVANAVCSEKVVSKYAVVDSQPTLFMRRDGG